LSSQTSHAHHNANHQPTPQGNQNNLPDNPDHVKTHSPANQTHRRPSDRVHCTRVAQAGQSRGSCRAAPRRGLPSRVTKLGSVALRGRRRPPRPATCATRRHRCRTRGNGYACARTSRSGSLCVVPASKRIARQRPRHRAAVGVN